MTQFQSETEFKKTNVIDFFSEIPAVNEFIELYLLNLFIKHFQYMTIKSEK